MHVSLIFYVIKCFIPKCYGYLQDCELQTELATFPTEHHFHFDLKKTDKLTIHTQILDSSLKMN